MRCFTNNPLERMMMQVPKGEEQQDGQTVRCSQRASLLRLRAGTGCHASAPCYRDRAQQNKTGLSL